MGWKLCNLFKLKTLGVKKAHSLSLVTRHFRMSIYLVKYEELPVHCQSPSATPALCCESPRTGSEDEATPHRAEQTRDVPGTDEEDTWGTCTVRSWSLRAGAQSLLTNFQSVEEWSPSRGVVISRWRVACDPVTHVNPIQTSTIPTNHCIVYLYNLFGEIAKLHKTLLLVNEHASVLTLDTNL